MNTDSTADTAVVTSEISRTANGRCRAVNMMSTAPTSGIQVMIDNNGNGITPRPQGPEGRRGPSLMTGRRNDENAADARRRRREECGVRGVRRSDERVGNEADAAFSSLRRSVPEPLRTDHEDKYPHGNPVD